MAGRLLAKVVTKAAVTVATVETLIQAGERAIRTNERMKETAENLKAARKQGDKDIEKAVKDIRDGN